MRTGNKDQNLEPAGAEVVALHRARSSHLRLAARALGASADHLLFVGPAFALVLAIVVFPLIYTVGASLFTWNLGQAQGFVGADNYAGLLSDPNVWLALRVTFEMTALAVGFEFLLGVTLALLVNRQLPFLLKSVLRTGLLIPMFTAPVVVGSMFRMLLNPQFGAFQFLVGQRGLAPTSTDPFALLSIVAADVWQWTPFMFLIFLAALQAVPQDILEAAQVDGATAWQQAIHVLLPQIANAIIIALLLRFMDALKIFDIIYVLTQGGPGRSTQNATYLIYQVGLQDFYTGEAAALACILLVILSVLVTIFIGLAHRRYKLL